MNNLLFSSSKSGASLLQVTINSFLFFLKDDLHIYILCSGWNKEFRKSFEFKLKKSCKITYIDIDDSIFDGINNTVGLPVATLYRLCGIEMLPPEVHEILYTDIDVVCVSSEIQRFMNRIKDECKTVAAVPDAGIPDTYASNVLGNHLMDYFNAGVLYLNVDYCRSINLWQKSKELLIGNKLVAVDQDILNIIFKDNYYPLSHKYNYMSPQVFKDLMFYRKKNVLSSFSPVLIHYDGPQKPWYYLCANPYKRLFTEIANDSNVELDYSLNRSRLYKLKLFYQYLKYRIVGKL